MTKFNEALVKYEKEMSVLLEDVSAKEVKSQEAVVADPEFFGQPSYTVEFDDGTSMRVLFDPDLYAEGQPAYSVRSTEQKDGREVAEWHEFDSAEAAFQKLKSSIKISLDPKAVKLFVTAAKKRSSK